MSKVKTIEEVVDKLYDGATVLLGGFLGVGAPLNCIDAIAASGVKDLTLISDVSGIHSVASAAANSSSAPARPAPRHSAQPIAARKVA